jgi:hypothetical protein
MTEINREAEPVLGMSAIERRIREITGYKPGRSTLHRWLLKGRLRATRIGGRFYATERAIREMLEADEQRNHGSVGARGQAAAARIDAISRAMPARSRRTKGGRR